MSLSKIFTSNKKIFRAALKANDVAALRPLIGTKLDGSDLYYESTHKSMTTDVMRMLMDEMSAENWSRWLPPPKGRSVERHKEHLLEVMAARAIQSQRPDLLDLVLQKKTDFNHDKANESCLLVIIIESGLPDAVKADALRKMLRGGFDKIENAQDLLQKAATLNFIQGVDVLAEAGLDIHAGEEQLLRNAAKASQTNLCLHLMTTHKADVGLAARAARKLDNVAEATFLETYVAAAQGKPATLESLSAEMRELKAAFRELVAELHEMRLPEKRLDKPGLPAPAISSLPKGMTS